MRFVNACWQEHSEPPAVCAYSPWPKEEYVTARQEVSVEVINQGDYHRAIAVTDKYLGNEPH
ncbi:hypothetical protein PPNK14_31410 [Pectobacterium parmentieri]